MTSWVFWDTVRKDTAKGLNLRDNGINVIVGQRKGGRGWQEAVRDGWVEGQVAIR